MSMRFSSSGKVMLTLGMLGLFICMGSGPSNSGSAGCSDMTDLLGSGPVTPVGTGGPTSPAGSSTPVTPAAAAALQLSVGSSGTEAAEGQTISFGATATGGTPPYYYYWMLDSDGGWSQAGPTYAITANFPGESRIMYAQVVDSAGAQSNLVQIEVKTTSQTTQQPNGCNTIAGTWTTNYGTMILDMNGTGTNEAWGNTDDIRGTLTQGEGACSGCSVLTGTWVRRGAGNESRRGAIRFVFEPDRKSFLGTWTYDPNTHPEADYWSGYRDNCN
jgi:hypothetical protein